MDRRSGLFDAVLDGTGLALLIGVNEIITPRWEWRSFGGAFDAIETRVSGPSRTSHEVYVLCDSSDTNVKIRDHVIEVKVLQRMHHGLELWSPAFKAPFPLNAPAIRRVFELWPLPAPALRGDPYSELEFVTELAGEVAGLHVIGIAKTRRQSLVDQCQVEIGAISVAGRTVPTVAVEMTDPEHVLRVVRDFHLDHYENLNYVNFLKHVLQLRILPPAIAPPEGASHEETALPLGRTPGALPRDPLAGANPGAARR
jgi:hypothetical protein